MKSWKTPLVRLLGTFVVALQWSHDYEVVENRYRSKEDRAVRLASMEPRL